MLSEEEKRAIDFLKGVCTDDCVNKAFVVTPILNLIENQQKELNTLKEIEQLHQEENGKLRFELVKITSEKSIGEYQYKQLLSELDEEKEKNKDLQKQLNGAFDRGFISKDKIKAIQGQLIMQLGSYVRNEASPEQERIAGGINIINEILEENNE